MMGPLSGKIIISTRPITEVDQIHQQLANKGATVVHIPMIEISASADNADTDKELKKLDSYQWIVFTSSNGIKFFFDALKKLNCSFPRHIKIAAYGNRTAGELNKYKLAADFIYHGTTSTDFFRTYREEIAANENILLVQGNLAPQYLAQSLSTLASVKRINIYQTTLPKHIDQKALRRIENDQYDLILFTSPSGFKNIKLVIDNKVDISKLRAVSIGKRTAKAIEQDVKPLLVAETPDAEGIIKSILKYYQNNIQTK